VDPALTLATAGLSVAPHTTVNAVSRVSQLAFAVCLAALSACARRESAEVTRARATETFLLTQLADLERLVAKAEKGELTTQGRIAIGIAEGTAKSLLDASLPREQMLGGRVQLRIESAEPFFRGNNAALLFRATARGMTTGITTRLELGGRLTDFRIDKGQLSASVEIAHFKVVDSSLGNVASDVLERVLRDNLQTVSGLLPSLDLPVHLEESINVDGLDEGVVKAHGGGLPLDISLAEVIPVNERLWILLDAKAGPWRTLKVGKGT
jgi:hypothetical protein